MATPRIAITSGEPAGIGPDILLYQAQQAWPAQLVAVADPDLLARRAAALDLDITLTHFDPHTAATPHTPGSLPVAALPLARKERPGVLDSANSGYVLATLEHAVQGALKGTYQALVTAPVQKSVINESGHPFSGHTEFFAEACGCDRVVMLLAAGELRVALATTHLPLAAVPAAITSSLLEDVLGILHNELQHKFGLASPAIAVLGLNPHAGESGHLGREEIDVIEPTLARLRGAGMNLQGPLPADTAFNPALLNGVDAYLAMYHDQGLPVLKYAGFGEAVNITLGLPVIRTSVDHGTALDLAGSGRADAGSLAAAIRSALEMIDTREGRHGA
ncbi:MAG: 4-hydroxythreonine-4-phosphate dehydrogenase PdxA [Pseudomonadota bacterium]